jgi:hypothetical protein
MCVVIFFTSFAQNISHSKNESDMIKMCIDLHVKYPLFLSDFNETRIFSKDCRKYSNIMKIRPVGAELFYTDRQTWSR